MRIKLIQHEEWLNGGCIVPWAKRNNHQLLYVREYKYEPIPTEVDADMLIVLGGPQDPNTTKEECPYYNAPAIRELIKKYVDDNKIVIGFCLGSQLIGEALGAKFAHSPLQEVGYVEGTLTVDGRREPFFADFPNKVNIGAWHNDMPGLTKDAVIIMVSEGCPRQIVKYSKYVYGFQTHMEFDHRSYLEGIKESAESLKLKGPYIKNKKEIERFDTTEMKNLLFSFLDRMIKDYLE